MAVETVRGLAIAVLLAAHLVACGGGEPARVQDPSYTALVEPGTREPADDGERAILVKLGELEPGVEAAIDGYAVVAAAPYAAASGRTCRSVVIRADEGKGHALSRLACLIDGAWAFVPEVFQPVGAPR